MITISLCMIVKNEEDVIERCLECIKDVVDEIIIVDTGSTDRTKELVSEYTNKIYDFEWIDDFAAARNESFSHATKDYIMWLDADDILLEKDIEKLNELKKNLDEGINAVYFYYNCGLDSLGNPTLRFKRERLIKRSCNFKWIGFIHECIPVEGNIVVSDIVVTHGKLKSSGSRNLDIFKRKKEEGEVFDARYQYYYAKEYFYRGLFDEATEELMKYLEMDGYMEDRVDAMNCLSDCYILKKEYKKARDILFQCFHEFPPRAETLFRIGSTFILEKRYKEAIFWDELIFKIEKPADTQGFQYEEFWTWKPHLDLCVCYYYTGQVEKSKMENEKAGEYIPDSEAVKQNRKYFDSLDEKL